MKKLLTYVCIACLFVTGATFYACKKNANDRNTLSLVDDGTVLSLSAQEYSTFITANPPVTGTPDAAKVQRVGAKLTAAANTYLISKNQQDLVKDYNWEFNLVNNAEVNAWCLPGGKIVVYSGIMPLMPTDEDLAVVMGHEIAHAILKHGNERMSQQLLVQYGGVALSALLSSKPEETRNLFAGAYGVSSTLGVLAFSRRQETESDEMGLYIMATAGYNPNAAVAFWQRMQANSGSSSTPVFLSTHPSDEQRVKDIQALLPKAMVLYHP